MKKNIAIILAVLAFALIGCEQNTPYEPGKPAATDQYVFFPVSAELGVELDPAAGITSHDIVIERTDAAKAQTVKLKVLSNTDNVFKIPETVEFKVGQTDTILHVEFGEMKIGTSYSFSVQVDWSEINPYAITIDDEGAALSPIYSFEVTPIQYTRGTGVFIDNPVLGLIGLDPAAWTANFKYAELPDGTIKFVILNPYTTPATGVDEENGIYIGCPYTNVGLTVDDSQDYNMVLYIDGEDVIVEDFDLGLIYPGVGMCSILNYKGNTSYGVFDAETGLIAFDQDSDDNNSVFYVATYAQNYAGFYFYLSVEAFVADNAYEEGAPAKAKKVSQSNLIVPVDHVPTR